MLVSEENAILGRRYANKELVQYRIPCLSCRKLYVKRTLYRHHRTCSKENLRESGSLTVSSKRLLKVHNSANNILRKNIFPLLRDDEISKTKKNDELIILFGNKLTRRYGGSHLSYHI